MLQLRHLGDSDVTMLFILLLRNLSRRIWPAAVKKPEKTKDEFGQQSSFVDGEGFDGLRDPDKMPAVLKPNHFTGLFQAPFLRTGTWWGAQK